MVRVATGIAALLLTAALAIGCGGAVCGDGKLGGSEECDDGNTRDDDACSNTCHSNPTVSATLRWYILKDAAPGFTQDSCSTGGGVGAASIHILVEGPIPTTTDVACEYYQYQLRALRPGDYTVTGFLVASDGTVLTKGQTQTQFTIDSSSLDAELNFQIDDFQQSYVGDLIFQVGWLGPAPGGAAVAQQLLHLTRDGADLPGLTQDLCPIDGVTPCTAESATAVQRVNDLTWGPADMEVTGLAADGTHLYHGSFPTFVGAGYDNPWIQFDVPTLQVDAGPPDAHPVVDAGPVDAAPVDAAAPDVT